MASSSPPWGWCHAEGKTCITVCPRDLFQALSYLHFYDDLRIANCTWDENETLERYADNTTLTCIGETMVQVANKMNKFLGCLSDWCHRSSMAVHPKKSEAMLIKHGDFVVQWVRKSRSLSIVIDNQLKWTDHVQEVQLSFARKLNLLKLMTFLPKSTLVDLYWKVIFPSVMYGTTIFVWGNCNSTKLKTLCSTSELHISHTFMKYKLTLAEDIKQHVQVQTGLFSTQMLQQRSANENGMM